MDKVSAEWLVSPAAAPALEQAASFPDPRSLAAGTAMRQRWSLEQSAAALTQVALRRKASAKFGELAKRLFFTSDGLQQATRKTVADWRAGRFQALGVRAVADLGCGIAADSMAFARAGLRVRAVDADPVTAVFAAANLRAASPNADAEVVCATAQDAVMPPTAPDEAIFLDPARRTASGRSWRLDDLSPSWEFCLGAIRDRPGCVKAGPGLEHSLIPDDLGAVWVSESGELVELCLWSGDPAHPSGSRTALLLPAGEELPITAGTASPRLGGKPRYLYEPDPAVIRSGGLAAVAELVSGWPLRVGIGYIASAELVRTSFATAFTVLAELAFDERVLRSWVKANDIGVLEIKTRGLGVDPATLRRRLRPKGSNPATLVLSPTEDGARAFVVQRPFQNR
ncbi:MAG: class I SAM-dependent methyltransferase [Propionibacteriaceae bacterium]|jgi:hypothetical protein|nr:class I SAM-dependent methyltransferase [Propionibacteriaceae bacterium]